MPEALTASVECIECRRALGELTALSRSELCGVVASLVVAAHAAQPHCSHPLRVVLDDVKAIEHELTIRCLSRHCTNQPPYVVTCPIEIVAAIAVIFHTSHEGHPFELTYNGRTWTSPLP